MVTPQFWLLWLMLALNTTARIGILEQASPMIQDFFKGHISVAAAGFAEFTEADPRKPSYNLARLRALV